MKTEMCLVVCFLVGVLVFYLLKQGCGCAAVVEGQTEIDCDERIIQIQTDFENLEDIDTLQIDDVYIAIGTKLSLSELLYIKKSKRDDFKKVDFEYVKNIASCGKRCGAKSLSFISAIGANNRSLNTYLNVKG